MKTSLLIILFFALSLGTFAQDCFWAKKAGTSQAEEGLNMATDLNGNVYVVGNKGLNALTIGTTSLSGTSNFIAKYSAGGNFIWAKNLPGEARGISIDNLGEVYISGSYGGTKSFGSITLTALNSADGFAAKLDSAGTFIWAQSFGGQGGDYPESIAVDDIGNVYATGSFRSDTLFAGSDTLFNSNAVTPDFFIIKLNSSNGSFDWAKSAGENGYEYGYGITTDSNNDIYVTGTYASDSIQFGSTWLHTVDQGSSKIFMAKYNTVGAVLWANGFNGHWGDALAFDIKADASNSIYITGELQGSSLTLGVDSLVNHSAGSTDVFVAKFDSNGNAIWAKSAGGTNYDYAGKLALDASGNVYAIGNFTSITMYFGNDSITHGNTSYRTFIGKYDNSGILQYVKNIGGIGSDFGRGIATGIGDNVYFTGSFSTPTLSFANTTLTNSGGNDFYVADLFSFSSSIIGSTNASCNGSNDGAIFTTVSGGNTPITYSWSTVPPQTTPDANNLIAGSYVVTITEGFGCAQTSAITITEPPADLAEICIVSVDSISQNNIIIWDKSSFTNVDSFIVYREIATNNYQPIGSVPFDSLSMFVDTVRTLYFPNTGNPNGGSYRYKIQAKSACGGLGPLSPFHNTIYILNSGGTFYWTQPYTIQGGPNPVSSYVLMRDDNSTGNWQQVGSVAGTQQTINDPLYTIFQSTATWRLEAQLSVTCDPTRSINVSRSNNYSNSPVAIKENNAANNVSVFPNPFSGSTTIFYTLNQKSKVLIEIYNVIGQKLETITNEEQSSGKHQYNFNTLEKVYDAGVYFVKFSVDGKSIVKRIIEVQ